MSLLIVKALEKGAKDRGEAQETPPAAAAEPAPAAEKAQPMELTLEPLPADVPAPPQPAAAQPAKQPQSRASREQARAATVMQATARPAPAVARGPRIRPVMAIGIVAAVVALGFAVYAYLQITNPGLFIRQPRGSSKAAGADACTGAATDRHQRGSGSGHAGIADGRRKG